MAIFCQKNVKSLGLTINTKEFPDNKKYGIKYGLSCSPMLLNMISNKPNAVTQKEQIGCSE